MKIGKYEFHKGQYPGDFGVLDFGIKGPGLYLDIDWTDDKLPVGWCAGFRTGPVTFHWSWNAPFGEPNRINIHLGKLEMLVSCFTWWKEITDRVEGRVVYTHRERCRPYLEDDRPMIRFYWR